MKPIKNTPRDALAKFFPNVQGFRDCQEEVVQRVFDRRSSLALMPTGAGKSLTYQLPVLASGGIGIVISPLIALMQQQEDAVKAKTKNVLSLGGADASDVQKHLRTFPWTGGAGFLFVSPERAENDGYLEFLVRKHNKEIALVAIDEAHCISQWGDDFRPPYKNLPGLLDRCFGRDSWPTVLCLTATLDALSQSEILRDFRLTEADVVRSTNMLRTNLALSFHSFEDGNEKLDALDSLLDKHRGEKLIVYAHRKKSETQGTKALAERYSKLGHVCAPFDADLSMELKAQTLTQFASGQIKVVFATGAFGMGIDIPDIRGVIHFLLPESIEQYYQEVGRAGRDGSPAFGILLYTPANSRVRRDMIRKTRRTIEDIRKVWTDTINRASVDLKTISPWEAFQGNEDTYALYYAFQRIGAIQIQARGPGRLQCLASVRPKGAEFLAKLDAATKTGSIAAAMRKLDLDPSVTIHELFEAYDRDEIKFILSPDKTLFYLTREIQEVELQQITDEINTRVDEKLRRFEEFVAMIEAGSDPGVILQAKFGK